jgi:tRNA U34 5-methylaminomethyl-2-thiouridine-forming methyltransferase MnmC
MQSPSNIANIEWRDGQPYASEFQDVYFSTDNGLLETDYVFLQGNHLAERWLDSDLQTFNIAETGFGTGLNFLCAVNAWLSTSYVLLTCGLPQAPNTPPCISLAQKNTHLVCKISALH